MSELKLVEGHTGVIDETLKTNGTAVDLTGMTVALLLQTADGTPVATLGNVTVPSPSAGLVRYSPAAADLLAADTPHVARWKVIDAGGHIVFFPSDAGEVWEVQPADAVALPDNALVTIAELKAALQIKGTEQDLALAAFITACSDGVETLTGRRLASRTYTDEYLYVRADRVLGIEWLDVEWPITALTALAVSGTLQSLWQPGSPGSPEDRDVFVLEARDPKHGRDRLFKPGGWPIGALVQRTYTAGYGGTEGPGMPALPIPADLKQAVLALAVDWYYARTRQAEPVISRTAGAETVTYVNEALPRRFPTLLNAYRRWP
jgi:uncharacterized phiE125 gp8 family phage protein